MVQVIQALKVKHLEHQLDQQEHQLDKQEQVLLEKVHQLHQVVLKDLVDQLEQEVDHQVHKQNPNTQLNNRSKLTRQIKRLLQLKRS